MAGTGEMSKVIPISPEAVPEKNSDEMLVMLRVSDLRVIMDGVVEAVLKRQQPPIQRIVYPLKEAAEMLSVPPTWLAAKARAGEIKCVRLGHYVTFAEQDLREFVEKAPKEPPVRNKGKRKA
jgi:hypothetical protein